MLFRQSTLSLPGTSGTCRQACRQRSPSRESNVRISPGRPAVSLVGLHLALPFAGVDHVHLDDSSLAPTDAVDGVHAIVSVADEPRADDLSHFCGLERSRCDQAVPRSRQRPAAALNTTRDRAHPTRPRVGSLTWHETTMRDLTTRCVVWAGGSEGCCSVTPARNLRWDQKSYPHCGRELHTRPMSDGRCGRSSPAWLLEIEWYAAGKYLRQGSRLDTLYK